MGIDPSGNDWYAYNYGYSMQSAPIFDLSIRGQGDLINQQINGTYLGAEFIAPYGGGSMAYHADGTTSPVEYATTLEPAVVTTKRITLSEDLASKGSKAINWVGYNVSQPFNEIGAP